MNYWCRCQPGFDRNPLLYFFSFLFFLNAVLMFLHSSILLLTQILQLSRNASTTNLMQGSRKCGSTGAALLGNDRPNWGNDANWEKEITEENKERKRDKKEIGKKRKEKEEEEERRRGQYIIKNQGNCEHRNCNAKKYCEENIICWKIK